MPFLVGIPIGDMGSGIRGEMHPPGIPFGTRVDFLSRITKERATKLCIFWFENMKGLGDCFGQSIELDYLESYGILLNNLPNQLRINELLILLNSSSISSWYFFS